MCSGEFNLVEGECLYHLDYSVHEYPSILLFDQAAWCCSFRACMTIHTYILISCVFQSTAAVVVEQLLSALQYDNQLSVRYLIEWQIVLLLRSHPQLVTDLFLPCLNFVRTYVCVDIRLCECEYICMCVCIH